MTDKFKFEIVCANCPSLLVVPSDMLERCLLAGYLCPICGRKGLFSEHDKVRARVYMGGVAETSRPPVYSESDNAFLRACGIEGI